MVEIIASIFVIISLGITWFIINENKENIEQEYVQKEEKLFYIEDGCLRNESYGPISNMTDIKIVVDGEIMFGYIEYVFSNSIKFVEYNKYWTSYVGELTINIEDILAISFRSVSFGPDGEFYSKGMHIEKGKNYEIKTNGEIVTGKYVDYDDFYGTITLLTEGYMRQTIGVSNIHNIETVCVSD